MLGKLRGIVSSRNQRKGAIHRTLLPASSRITVHGDEICKILSQFLIPGGIRREIGQQETLQSPVVHASSEKTNRISKTNIGPLDRNYPCQRELSKSNTRALPVEHV